MATRSHAASASGASGEGGRSLDSARLPLRLSRSALSEGCEVARCSEGWAGLGAPVLVLIEFFARASEAAPTLLSLDFCGKVRTRGLLSYDSSSPCKLICQTEIESSEGGT